MKSKFITGLVILELCSAGIPQRFALLSSGGSFSSIDVLTSIDVFTLVGELTEQLRLILEPTMASRLAGDYKSGKRISMKKVIAYIASHYRKDKIWLRRTRPDKRKYQVGLPP